MTTTKQKSREEIILQAQETLAWFDKELNDNAWPPFDFKLYELINDLTNELQRSTDQKSVHDFMNEAMSKFFPRS
jgi:hypothetical protein